MGLVVEAMILMPNGKGPLAENGNGRNFRAIHCNLYFLNIRENMYNANSYNIFQITKSPIII